VITAEASTVNDTTAYPSLPIAYSVANVGYAAVGGTASNGNQLFGAPLTAPFSAGSAITSPIQSNVVATGSSGTASKATTYDFSTLQVKQLTGQTLTNADILGTVGSEADIPLSDAFSASTNVTMAWRARNQTENGSAWLVNSGANWAPIFKNTGAQWLTSDIVQVAGVPTTTSSASVFAYAMEMSYDNGINTSIEPGSINTVQGAYLAKALLDGNGNVTQWENAVDFDVIPAHTDVGADARTAYNGSLSSFISNYANPGGYSLDQLVGSWGVDTANQESWAIIDSGGGDFAVVPEPSTIALLAVAAGGLLLYGLRRRMRAASPAVA
jgi:hypothetical protein